MVIEGLTGLASGNGGIIVEDNAKEQLALFKFGLISPILNGQVYAKDYLAKIAAQKHDVPGDYLSQTRTLYLL